MPISYPYKFTCWYGYDQSCSPLTEVTTGSAVTSGQPFEPCFDTTDVAYWHDGSAALPTTGDTCYTSSAGTTILGAGWRRQSSNSRMLINISGSVDSTQSC